MVHQSEIKTSMDVRAQDGTVVAQVDHVEGGTDSIRLTRDLVTGVHHWIPMSWVRRVNGKGVHLHMQVDEVRETWQTDPPHA